MIKNAKTWLDILVIYKKRWNFHVTKQCWICSQHRSFYLKFTHSTTHKLNKVWLMVAISHYIHISFFFLLEGIWNILLQSINFLNFDDFFRIMPWVWRNILRLFEVERAKNALWNLLISLKSHLQNENTWTPFSVQYQRSFISFFIIAKLIGQTVRLNSESTFFYKQKSSFNYLLNWQLY